MEKPLEQPDVVHNAQASRFEVQAEGHLAVMEYQMRGGRMLVTHTGVPAPIEGKGIASRLAKAALQYAREKDLKVVPACEFMVVYLRRHPEHQDLVWKA